MHRRLPSNAPGATLWWLILLLIAAGCAHRAPATAHLTMPTDSATVHRQLDQRYAENARAFNAKDMKAIMALRTPDFHSVTPDSVTHDYADMEQRTRGLLNGVKRWISVRFDIVHLELEGDLARAMVKQHVDRMALRPDGKVHHVETWVTQRETWRWTAEGWKLYRVDDLHDQRRLVDGQPE